jgi:type II secretory pathway pseudopilin PulG
MRMASEQRAARRRLRVLLRDTAGFSLVEAVVAMALLGLMLAAILGTFSASWRAEVKAFTDQEVQAVARDMLHRIVHGDPRPAVPVIGLVRAREVVTDPANSALAYRVTWTDESEVVHDDAVLYYASEGTLYRQVFSYADPLDAFLAHTSGGTALAHGVTAFELSDPGVLPVEIAITITHHHGEASITVQTRVTPRNLATGG